MENLPTPYKSFEFDYLTQIILQTQRDKAKLWKEWRKMKEFLHDFPEYCANNEHSEFNDTFVIDCYRKIYRQMIDQDMQSDDFQVNGFPLFYYCYEPAIKTQWKKEGVPIGEFDSNGMLNTGCAIVFKAVQVDPGAFTANYLGLNN